MQFAREHNLSADKIATEEQSEADNIGIWGADLKMSWIRSAVNKAVEVGNKNNLTRTVKNYADSVVQQAGQAVAEGAKLFQDRIVILLLSRFSTVSICELGEKFD